jgi:hypothetical protein
LVPDDAWLDWLDRNDFAGHFGDHRGDHGLGIHFEVGKRLQIRLQTSATGTV